MRAVVPWTIVGLAVLVLQQGPRASSLQGWRAQTAVPIGEAGSREIPRPPEQPAAGPGGADYLFSSVVSHVFRKGAQQYWIFEPEGGEGLPTPVVVFLHGWGAMAPWPYEAWICHLVRRGNIVIYPRYQETLATLPAATVTHAAVAIQAALTELEQGHHARPDRDRVAMVGHSLGGVIAANLAAEATHRGLPVPRALMIVQPGDPPRTSLLIARGQPSIMVDYGRIDSRTLLLVVTGDRDAVVGEETAREIFYGAWQVLPDQKDYVRFCSDFHGRPALLADHYLPTAVPSEAGPDEGSEPGGLPGAGMRLPDGLRAPGVIPPGDALPLVWMQLAAVRAFRLLTGQPQFDERLKPPNALDFYGVWKLLDALTDAAFYGRNREFALGNTPQQRFMGHWNDGVPVVEPVVTDRP